MVEEDDGVAPTTTKIESEEQLKDENHSEHEIEDEPSPPPLLDMIDLPPVSPLPPTPPLPSSPRDLIMEQQDSEDEGPPPGWDNEYQLKEQAEELLTPTTIMAISSDLNMEQNESKVEGPPSGWDNAYQLKEQAEQLITPTAVVAIFSDIKTDDVRNEEGQPPSQAQSSPVPEVVPSDLHIEQNDSEDEGPPPGWDNGYQLKEQTEKLVTPTTVVAISSDLKTEDVQRDVRNEGQPPSQAQSSPVPELVPSDSNMEQNDSEDEGPPPGWDNGYQLKEQAEQLLTPTAVVISSDIKMEDVQRDVWNEEGLPPQSHAYPSPASELIPSDVKVEQQDSEDEGPPPGWDSKCQPEPKLEMALPTTPPSDIKTEDVHQDIWNEDDPQQELVPLDIKLEQPNSEDEGPPPGWDSKCQPELELQTSNPTTPRTDIKVEHDQQDDEGPPPGWGSTPQQQSQAHSSLPSPSGASEEKNVKVNGENPQPPSRQQSIHFIEPQMPKPPMTINEPEMGQMVCGSCRQLLSYPRGARYVECECCLEENYVLEEHEVGQVVCGGCNVLLMYPYGAPKVKCANCSAETEIGDQNRRPPLSEQQSRARRHLKRVHAG